MADPIRLQVMKALTALLEGVTPANGFETDLTGAVTRGRQLHGDNDTTPLVAILENPRAQDSQRAGEHQFARYDRVSILVQGWTDTDSQHPTDPAYRVAEDVETRLGEVIATTARGEPLIPQNYLLGGLISEMQIGSYAVRPPSDHTGNKAFFYLELEIALANEDV